MRKGASINIESGKVWYPAFVAEVWDTDVGTYLTIYYATTEWYKAYVEYAEYRPSTNTIVYTTEDGGESEHQWKELDEEVSFSPSELDSLLQQEMADYDENTKEQAWQAWTAMTHHQKQAMAAGMHHLLEKCASQSHTHASTFDV
jgi:hypothetical protein